MINHAGLLGAFPGPLVGPPGVSWGPSGGLRWAFLAPPSAKVIFRSVMVKVVFRSVMASK